MILISSVFLSALELISSINHNACFCMENWSSDILINIWFCVGVTWAWAIDFFHYLVPLFVWKAGLTHTHSHTHQALVSEGVVNTTNEEPERPEVLKAELQHKVCQQHQSPDHQKLQVQERTETKRKWCYSHPIIQSSIQLWIRPHTWPWANEHLATCTSNSIMGSSIKSNPMKNGSVGED